MPMRDALSEAVGRCGPELDRPRARSHGQVVDHVAIAYPDLDSVLAHLEARGTPILEGPVPLRRDPRRADR